MLVLACHARSLGAGRARVAEDTTLAVLALGRASWATWRAVHTLGMAVAGLLTYAVRGSRP